MGRNTVNLALTKRNGQGQEMNVALKSREKIPSQWRDFEQQKYFSPRMGLGLLLLL